MLIRVTNHLSQVPEPQEAGCRKDVGGKSPRKHPNRHMAMGQKPVPPVNIPICTKVGSKIGVNSPTPKWDPISFDNHGHIATPPTHPPKSQVPSPAGRAPGGCRAASSASPRRSARRRAAAPAPRSGQANRRTSVQNIPGQRDKGDSHYISLTSVGDFNSTQAA